MHRFVWLFLLHSLFNRKCRDSNQLNHPIVVPLALESKEITGFTPRYAVLFQLYLSGSYLLQRKAFIARRIRICRKRAKTLLDMRDDFLATTIIKLYFDVPCPPECLSESFFNGRLNLAPDKVDLPTSSSTVLTILRTIPRSFSLR